MLYHGIGFVGLSSKLDPISNVRKRRCIRESDSVRECIQRVSEGEIECLCEEEGSTCDKRERVRE